MSDPLMQVLARLPAAELERDRAERIRSDCRERLLRPARRASASRGSFVEVWQPLIATLGAAYLIGAIAEAFRIYRLI